MVQLPTFNNRSSMECKNSALCIVDKLAIQSDIEHSYVEPYYPISGDAASGGPIEFHIEGNTEDCIDCNDLYIYLKYKILKADDKDIVSVTDKIGVSNLPLASLFRGIRLVVMGDRAD